MAQNTDTLKNHPVVSKEKWLAARKKLLLKEKKFTKLRDQLSVERRKLPWVRVDKDYVFETSIGPQSLSRLFDGRSQLIVYHFMFDPSWDEGCAHCSFWADNFNPIGIHLNHRDVTMIAISQAPLKKIEPFKKRMGWNFKWVSSNNNDFNFDFGVSFRPEELERGKVFYNYRMEEPVCGQREGVSAFYKNAKGEIYHTYSSYARGIDILNTAYNFLDLVAKGRDEDNLPNPQAWVRYHDRY